MTSWARLFAALIGVFAVTGGVRADMMLVSSGDIERHQDVVARSEPANQSTIFTGLLDYQSVGELQPGPIQYSVNAGIDRGRTSTSRTLRILNDGQSSLSLCLSAIIGLGLCSSAHCLKKLSFGFIPEWYHNGGPFQIGHSIAVNPDSICPVPAYCHVQPVRTAEDFIPQYHLGTIVSLWRKSQFTPDVIASRGPPVAC